MSFFIILWFPVPTQSRVDLSIGSQRHGAIGFATKSIIQMIRDGWNLGHGTTVNVLVLAKTTLWFGSLHGLLSRKTLT